MSKSGINISRQETLSTLTKLLLRNYMHALSNRYIASNTPQLATYSFDYIGTTISIDGVYEVRELDLINCFFEEHYSDDLKGTCLDIGANIGNHSVYFSKILSDYCDCR